MEHDKLQDFERIFLRFMRQIMHKTKWDSSFNEIFINTRKELLAFLEDGSYEKMYLEHSHLLDWFDSKVAQRPMIEVVMEKIDAQKTTYK